MTFVRYLYFVLFLWVFLVRLRLTNALYRRFWSLQDYFRRPSQCYEKVPWKHFVLVSSFTLIFIKEWLSWESIHLMHNRFEFDSNQETVLFLIFKLIFWLLESFLKKICWVGICLLLLLRYFHIYLYK